jgi:hypothetical protein
MARSRVPVIPSRWVEPRRGGFLIAPNTRKTHASRSPTDGRAAAGACLLACVLGLAACGSSSSSGSSSSASLNANSGTTTASPLSSGSPSQRVRAVISDVYTSTETSLCQTNFTSAGRAAFQSRSTGETCPQRIESNAALHGPGVTVHAVTVHGDSAVASVASKDGGSFHIDLVKQNGLWKINGLS